MRWKVFTMQFSKILPKQQPTTTFGRLKSNARYYQFIISDDIKSNYHIFSYIYNMMKF